MKKIRLGIVGCGGIAQMVHLPFIRDLDDRFDLAALCDINLPMAKDVAQHYRVDAVFDDYQEMVKQDIDAVMILSWGSHSSQVMAALEAGKHVFTEKPLCYNTREAEEIRRAVRKTGLKLMVGYMKRFDQGYLYAREQARSIEDLRFVQVTVLHPVDAMYREHYRRRAGGGVIESGPVSLPQPGSEEEFFRKLTTEGEDGALITEAIGEAAPEKRIGYFFMIASLIHDMNAVRGILGDPLEVLSTEVWHSGLCITSTLKFKDDVRCVMNWIYLPYQKNYSEELAFFGSSKRVRIQFPSPYLLHTPTSVVVQRAGVNGSLMDEKVTVSYEEKFRTELLSFYDYISGGKEPETTLEDAATDIYWLQKMAACIRT